MMASAYGIDVEPLRRLATQIDSLRERLEEHFQLEEQVVTADGAVHGDYGHGGQTVIATVCGIGGNVGGVSDVGDAACDVGPLHAA